MRLMNVMNLKEPERHVFEGKIEFKHYGAYDYGIELEPAEGPSIDLQRKLLEHERKKVRITVEVLE
ncbi:MAG: hypothetical protein ACYDG6_06790 [Thermincolia bacterium]